jgi:hypothetical protein
VITTLRGNLSCVTVDCIATHHMSRCCIQSLCLNSDPAHTQVCYSYATPALTYCFVWVVASPVIIAFGIWILIEPLKGSPYYHSRGWLMLVVGIAVSLLTYLFLSFQIFLQVTGRTPK